MWLPSDRNAALAWQLWEREHCSGCGAPKAESFDPANEFAYEGVPLECFSCSAQARSVEKMESRSGVYAYAEKKKRWWR